MTENVYGQPDQKWGASSVPKHLSEPAEPELSDVLHESDRCDLPRCGARAYVRAFIHPEFSVDYCAHHFGEHGFRVQNIALDVIDERWKLEQEVAR